MFHGELPITYTTVPLLLYNIDLLVENTVRQNNEHLDNDDLTQQATHVINVTSNLLELQRDSVFCDVCLVCSDGYVKGT